MKQSVRLIIAGEDYEAISIVLLEYVDHLKHLNKVVKTDESKALAKRIVRYLARAKKRPTIVADFIQQMRKNKNGEDELCYLACLKMDGQFVPIMEAKQRNARSTAIKDAQAARRRVEANLDKEWA